MRKPIKIKLKKIMAWVMLFLIIPILAGAMFSHCSDCPQLIDSKLFLSGFVMGLIIDACIVVGYFVLDFIITNIR